MVKITLKKGKIIEFESDTKNIGNYFLYWNKVLSSISLPNVTKIGDCFLFYNEVLDKLYAPKLKKKDMGDFCLDYHPNRLKFLKNLL